MDYPCCCHPATGITPIDGSCYKIIDLSVLPETFSLYNTEKTVEIKINKNRLASYISYHIGYVMFNLTDSVPNVKLCPNFIMAQSKGKATLTQGIRTVKTFEYEDLLPEVTREYKKRQQILWSLRKKKNKFCMKVIYFKRKWSQMNFDVNAKVLFLGLLLYVVLVY